MVSIHFKNAKYANSLIPIKHYIDCMPAGANFLLPTYIVIARILTHHDNIFWFGCVFDY